MSTTSLSKDYESAMKFIDTFVKNVFAGNDETQKKDLHENLLVLANLYTPSNQTPLSSPLITADVFVTS